MSSTMPPDGPQQPGGAAEYLEQGSGSLLPKDPATSAATRKRVLIGGGVLVGLAGVGAAAFAAYSFLASGPQPAEALPASTVGYVSLDLDPSGGQKIEAIRTLNKFPAFKEELDLDTDDDVIKSFFENAVECSSLDYDQDVAPWIGLRAAVAAVDLGDKLPTPVAVLQVTDADAADEGLAQLRDCEEMGEGWGTGGWVFDGDWAIIAETESIAQDVADEAAEGTLADDETYQRWTGEAGDPGILSAYVAPEAAEFIADELGSMFFPGVMSGESLVSEMTEEGEVTYSEPEELQPEVPEELQEALDDFEGMAVTVRFDDGALELEAAGSAGQQAGLFGTTGGDDVVATLPEDTLAAIGVGFRDGWLSDTLEQYATGSGMSADEMLAELEAETGLTGDDVETLAGESAALAVGPDLDLETMFMSGDMSDFPIALKVKGDSDAIEGVLDKLRDTLPAEEASVLDAESEGDMTAFGPDPDYRSEVLGDGSLGDSDLFQNVIREAGDATALVFVNFNTGDWLTGFAEGDPELEDNLEPLQGLGISAWQDGDVSHGVLRLTTD